MKKLIILFLTLIGFSSCNKTINRPKPTEVVYQETISETDSQKIVRNSHYVLHSVNYDTIQKRQSSTIEQPKISYAKEPDDKVDLNDIFDPNREGDVDYNFTELDDEDWLYLERIGVYWDDGSGCYRKRAK